MSESAATAGYVRTENRRVEAVDGTSFAYRDLGSTTGTRR